MKLKALTSALAHSLLTALPLLLCAFSLRAQTPAPLPTPPATPSASAAAEAPVHTITLDVVASHKSEPPVANLPATAFTVLDNKTPRPITSFKAFSGDNTPVAVVIVIDAVNTPFTLVAQAREQIDHFLKSNEGRLTHPTTLAIFTDTGFLIQPGYTRDGNLLAQSLDKQTIGLRDIRRSAGFYGAQERTQLSLSSLTRLSEALARQPGRKLVLWVSPGWPLLSGPRVDLDNKQAAAIFHDAVGFSAQLRQARITLYSISPIGAGESPGRAFYYEEYVKGLVKPNDAQLGDLALEVLSVQSGGQAFSNSNDLSTLIRSAYQDASAYYELSFDPTPAEHPDEYHHIDLQLAQPGLTLRTRQGYYNQP